ncbi:DUF1751 domain-containing protein [Thiospirochaeta perfilievii]|uniref:DUF1751 domain-containing protein n=1 Tax=Thiospirochaeta perfilievii TaxID=252967 RepID=A0A5C1QAZ2_9SPIO|nr:DUF1751 domain-containing protein [Thiospirochaeta perfilievii]QEN05225.1 DUF1751 domain-containing protein [Thiospirochaeta perfilievii]
MKNKLHKYAINNLTLFIIIGQVITYLAINSGYITYSDLSLSYSLIVNGEFWRVVSFVFIPPATSPIWSLLSWYILYLMGSNLEHFWGALHYNTYILVAVVLTNLTAYFFKLSIGTNYYFQSSIFLAFAFLNPNFTVRLFFILPIKIKWIALITWIFYAWALIFGSLGAKLLLIASLANFIIFFSKDIFYKIKYRGSGLKRKIEYEMSKNSPKHSCFICNKNDIDNPHSEFRYCSKCNPEQCYCEDHIKNHNHISE